MPRYLITAVVTVEVSADHPFTADVIALQGIQIARELTPTDRSHPLVAVTSCSEIKPVIIEGEESMARRKIVTGKRPASMVVPGACPRGGPHNYNESIEREPDKPFRVTRVTVTCSKCNDSYQSK